jgi:hypothetical protein
VIGSEPNATNLCTYGVPATAEGITVSVNFGATNTGGVVVVVVVPSVVVVVGSVVVVLVVVVVGSTVVVVDSTVVEVDVTIRSTVRSTNKLASEASLARNVTVKAPAVVATHVNTPDAATNSEPEGPTADKTGVVPSTSEAEIVNENSDPTVTDCAPGTTSTGGLFTGTESSFKIVPTPILVTGGGKTAGR